jgi:predicted  nucleic acid-binding Zn-ribbon protein
MVNSELEQLLALQECDVELDRLAGVARGLDAREEEMNRERATLADAVTRAREQLANEQQRERDLQRAAREHRELQNKFASQMDAVRKAKEAVAATTQLELAQRVVATDEQQLQSLQGRMRDLQQATELHELELAEADDRRTSDREALAADRARLGDELEVARARRADRASVVARQLLNRYDRLRTRGHAAVLVRLEGTSCGNCRTAVPMQRRNEILAGRRIEACEGCGVLLYATG